MISDLLDLLVDSMGDLVCSFRGGRFYGKEWLAKLIMRLLLAAISVAFALLLVMGINAEDILLIAIGAVGFTAAMIGEWRLYRIWHQEHIEDRQGENRQNQKSSNDISD